MCGCLSKVKKVFCFFFQQILESSIEFLYNLIVIRFSRRVSSEMHNFLVFLELLQLGPQEKSCFLKLVCKTIGLRYFCIAPIKQSVTSPQVKVFPLLFLKTTRQNKISLVEYLITRRIQALCIGVNPIVQTQSRFLAMCFCPDCGNMELSSKTVLRFGIGLLNV